VPRLSEFYGIVRELASPERNRLRGSRRRNGDRFPQEEPLEGPAAALTTCIEERVP